MKLRPKSEDEKHRGSGKLQKKVALITGGRNGIGYAVALHFAKEGTDISVVYLNEHKDAKETKRLVENQGRKCSVGAMVNTEISSQASGFEMTVKEVPVSHFRRQHGKPTGGSAAVIVKAFRELIRLRRMLSSAPLDENGLFSEPASGPTAELFDSAESQDTSSPL